MAADPFHPAAVGVIAVGAVVWAVLFASSWGVKVSRERDDL